MPKGRPSADFASTDHRRERGDSYNAAARNLTNRYFGILFHCLQHRISYDEAKAFPTPTTSGGLTATGHAMSFQPGSACEDQRLDGVDRVVARATADLAGRSSSASARRWLARRAARVGARGRC